MGNALVKSSNFTVEIEASDAYGVDPNSSDTSIDNYLVELAGVPDFSDSFDTIERNIIRQAFSSYAPIRGTENTSGSVVVEAHGSSVYNTPLESAALYKGAFGYLIGPDATPDVVDAALSTTVGTSGDVTGTQSTIFTNPQMYTYAIDVASSADFQVGYPVRVYSSDGSSLILAGFIDEIPDATHITILSANTGDGSNQITFTSGDVVDCGYMFTLRDKSLNQVVNLPSLTMKYWRGNITRECYTGNIITQFSLDLSTGQLIQPTFNWEGKTVAYTTAAYSGSGTTFDSNAANPLVVKLTDIFMKDEDDHAFESCISNLNLSLTNEVFKKQCIATSGIGEVVRTARNVTGSLNTFYEDSSFQTNFKSEKTYSLMAMVGYTTDVDASNNRVQSSADLGNILAIYIPKLKFSEVSVSEDTGIFKYDSNFSCEPVSGDDEIIFAYL